MEGKLSWEEIKKRYPNEWVALINYDIENKSGIAISGTVIAHNRKKEKFGKLCKRLLPKYKIIARRFTGHLIAKPQELVKWKLSNMM